ncbi:MAG: hypothetical protein JWR33_1033 [Naasia sp.]|uniref:hypothetical protein n=1 Tax=Naasia sp. TaxID=2546198 RepID=UPI002631E4C3|nr:hypothetical protein [Naasia sp.]MCU1570292.1 hypothetical protein [Naasia sp.]
MNAQPSRRERFRPAELVGLSFGVALFTGIVVLVTARDFALAVIFFGIAFIVALVVLAMLALVTGPTSTGAPSDPPAAPSDSGRRKD